MHNRHYQEGIRIVQELKDLSVGEAANFIQRAHYVDAVRRDAERRLDACLPTEFGSAFIEEFCLRAPEIAVSWAKQAWDVDQSFALSLVTNVSCIVNQDLSGPWLTLDISRVADLAPKVLHVTISPGEALAQFAKSYRAFYKKTKTKVPYFRATRVSLMAS